MTTITKNDLAERIKERARELNTCEHKRTIIETDKRFGRLVVCLDCDTVIDCVGH